MKQLPTFPSLMILLMPTMAVGANPRFNGTSVAEIAAGAKSLPQRDEVALFTEGIGALAAGSALPIETLFLRLGFDYLGSVGADAALVVPRTDEAVAHPAVVSLESHHRFDRALLAKHDGGEGRFVVHALAGSDLARDFLKAFPGADLTGAARRGASERLGIRVAQREEALVWLAQRGDVYTIHPGGGARLHNATARRWVQGGGPEEGMETIWARGLRGEGQAIAILDTGADWWNCYLAEEEASPPPVVRDGETGFQPDYTRRKIVAYHLMDGNGKSGPMDSQGHGTLVAGNAAAANLGDPFSSSSTMPNGVAPAAWIIVQDAGYQTDDCGDIPALGCPMVSILEHLEFAWELGARLHNNSWGDQENALVQNVYTNIAADMDMMTWLHPEFLIICAAGNSGSRGENTVGSPSTAKNVLSIGATSNPGANAVASFSSRGWTNDERVKPDLVAPGVTVTPRWLPAARELHCSTRTVQGTSMSAPITAGAAALARQYYTEGWHPTGSPRPEDCILEPSAALLRATLIAGAAPLSTQPPPPSPAQGWGRVNLENSLYFEGNSRRLLAEDSPTSFTPASTTPYETQLTSDAAGEVVVVLAWSDYPATPGASPALVNDLDLEIHAPDGTIYRGNHFDPSTGHSLKEGPFDRRNNVEVARLPAMDGVYTLRVLPATILHGPQAFALVALYPDSTLRIDTEGWMLR